MLSANPLDQLADPGIGQAAGRLGDLGHLVEQLLLAGEELPGGCVGQRAGRGGRDGGDLGLFLGLSSSSAERGPVVVVADSRQPSRSSWPAVAGAAAFPAWASSHWRWTVRRWTRSVRANASIDDSSRCWRPEINRPAAACFRLVSPASRCSRSVRYSSSRAERRSSGASGGRPSMSICTTFRFGNPPRISRMSSLSRRTMTSSSIFLLDRHAAAEPLGVEDFQQGREAVGVAVVRRGGEEQPVLEPRRQVADGAGDLRVDGVLLAAGRGGVVGLVEDQQRAAAEVAQPVAQRAGVGLVDQQAVRDEEPGVRAPGIHAVAALAPDPGDVVLVEDLEGQAEAALQLPPATGAASTADSR